MKFWLGTHMPNWLADLDVPLFVSHRRLLKQKTWRPARASWALDSGGFTELSKYGEWRTTPTEYAHAVKVYADEIGNLAWAAPQDWMCEPWLMRGRTVEDHQTRTIASVLLLRCMVDTPIIPVLQGWELDDYLRHADAYDKVGLDLTREPIVGVGSVCRRQNTDEIGTIMGELAGLGLNLHGFGIKMRGLTKYSHHLASADSMAWSYNARRHDALSGCTHKSCANCPRWALAWRERLLALVGRPRD